MECIAPSAVCKNYFVHNKSNLPNYYEVRGIFFCQKNNILAQNILDYLKKICYFNNENLLSLDEINLLFMEKELQKLNLFNQVFLIH